jgi:hypothetical protein
MIYWFASYPSHYKGGFLNIQDWDRIEGGSSNKQTLHW